MVSENMTNGNQSSELNGLVEEFDQFEWQYLETKEDLRTLWSLDIMAYAICFPGAQGSPGSAFFITNRGLAFEMSYCYGQTNYDDLREILPELPKSLEELRPWEEWRIAPSLLDSMEKQGERMPWDYLGYNNINGWYWYGLHSGCWARIHESIWPSFYTLAESHHELWIGQYWKAFVRKAIADRTEQLDAFLDDLNNNYELIHECTEEEAREVARLGVVAWEETKQGWGGLLCKNGKAYFKLDIEFDKLQLPTAQRQEIRNNTLPGWQCYYCGLGHRLMIREEYYPRFRELTYGMGKNANLYRYGFAVLKNILEITE